MSKTAINKEQEKKSKCYSSILYTKKKKKFTNFCQMSSHPGLNFTKIIPKAGKLVACDHFYKVDGKYKCALLKENIKITLLHNI